MNTFLSIVNFITANYQAILSALIALVTAIIGVALLIPGDQPEKFLQGVLDFLTKFSNKPKV